MLCLACAEHVAWPLCASCRLELRDGPDLRLPCGLLITTAFHHRSAARRLVHRLKYGGLVAAADVLAATMAARLPAESTALVPVPRALARRVRYGVDPAIVLAERIGRIVGLPVVRALAPVLWWPRHATRSPGDRRPPRFHVIRAVPPRAVLVDDVVTTGGTMAAAASAAGSIRYGLAATSPGLVGVGRKARNLSSHAGETGRSAHARPPIEL